MNSDLISKQAVDTLIDELARAISDERCCISRGRSTATIMQDILDLPPQDRSVQDFVDKCRECGKQHSRTYGSRRKYLAYLDGVADGLNESRNDVNSVLDKIRAEIEQTVSRYSISRERDCMGQVEWSDRLIKESEVLQIIDKYRAESENRE